MLSRALRYWTLTKILGGKHMECASYFDFCRLSHGSLALRWLLGRQLFTGASHERWERVEDCIVFWRSIPFWANDDINKSERIFLLSKRFANESFPTIPRW